MEEIKNNKKEFPVIKIVIVILVIGFLYSTVSKMLFRARVKSLTGGVVDIKNSDQYQVKTKEGELMVSEEKGLEWPSDLPISIPKYNDGKVKAYSHLEDQVAWTIMISDTNEEYFETYKGLLEKDAWKAESEMASIVSMAQMQKDGYSLNIVWDTSSSGVLITITKTM